MLLCVGGRGEDIAVLGAIRNVVVAEDASRKGSVAEAADRQDGGAARRARA